MTAVIHFGHVVRPLRVTGVENYLIDYRSDQAIYHVISDESLVLPAPAADVVIGQTSDEDALRAAILRAQHRCVKSPSSSA